MVSGKQLFKCRSCGKQFRGGSRLDNALLWQQYAAGKQTYAQLAERYGCSTKTIQRRLDNVKLQKQSTFEAAVNLLIDTTYFGRGFGVMVFQDSISGQYLYKQYVRTETNKLYVDGFAEIVRRGISVQAVICDGRQGLTKLFGAIPLQMCQFHQIQIITRYLTKKPKSAAARELRVLAGQLTRVDEQTFRYGMERWLELWGDYLNERSVSALTGNSFYTHRRLRSAWLSLKRNLPWLFTCEHYRELMIPNTTNGLDGAFADLKNKLRNHNGLSQARKMKFIDHYFKV